MFSRFIVVAIGVLVSHSYAIAAAVQEVSPSRSAPSPIAPWAIEWTMPDRKDENTPETLIVCSEHSDEEVREYRSLIEKAKVLQGYTVLDGAKPYDHKQAENRIGYIVFIDNHTGDGWLGDCIEKYPDLKPIVTDFMQTSMLNAQKDVQILIRAGILPAGTPPSPCMTRFYYPTKDYYPTGEYHQRWVAHVGMVYSSDLSCHKLFQLGTFGIDPRSCQSAGICH